MGEQLMPEATLPMRPARRPSINPGPNSNDLGPGTLGSAIGCDFRCDVNQLVFVESAGELARMDLYPEATYSVIGSGYHEPQDLRLSACGSAAYVSERNGSILKVDLDDADRASATVITTGLNDPRQLFLDEDAGWIYTVEHREFGRMWQIDIATGQKRVILGGLQNAVGLALTADRRYAYISEEVGGCATGRISRFRLRDRERETVAAGFIAPRFLSWLDPSETELLMPEGDPANRLRSVNVLTGSALVVAQGLPAQPSSVTTSTPGKLLMCCDETVAEVFLAPPANQPDGKLLEGIGWIPSDWVQPSGLADTSHDSTYFYQVCDAPFAGSLPVMINFSLASQLRAWYYRVFVDGEVREDVFHGARWNGSASAPATNAPRTIDGEPGYYRVFTAAEADRWTALPGCFLDSTTIASGKTHDITVEFYDGTGREVLADAGPLTIYVDNELGEIDASGMSVASRTTPPSSRTSSTPCGVLLALEAEVESILGYASNIIPWATAAFAADREVAANAQNGWGRCGQLLVDGVQTRLWVRA
jgi:hypothetical protein